MNTYDLRVKKFKTNKDIRLKSKKTLYLFIKYKKQNKTLPFKIFTIEKENQTFFSSKKPPLAFNTPNLSRKPLEYIRNLIEAIRTNHFTKSNQQNV